jgi:glycosyltransferase involved in cell wall biosynthesis
MGTITMVDGSNQWKEIGGDDKMRLLNESICLLNPIAWPEPFGMVMLEALGCGTPVVVTRMGAAAEIVDDGVTGFLRTDEQSLVHALSEVESLNRAACRTAAQTRFSASRMASDHAQFYADVLAGPRDRAA